MNRNHMDQSQKLTILDRSFPILLDHPDDTPSRRHGISAQTERLHRIHGVSLLQSAWPILLKPSIEESRSNSSLTAAACGTSSTLLHRYYHNASLQDTNVWSTAMACTLLTAKLLEIPNMADIRTVIAVYAHLYRKRIVVVVAGNDDASKEAQQPLSASLLPPQNAFTPELINAFLKPSGMSPLGPLYEEWKQALIKTEHAVLRALGFLLHWIPNQMPHKYLGPMLLLGHDNASPETVVAAQQGSDSSDLHQRAWDYCNDSLYLDLATRVPPHVIATAAILLALLDVGCETSSVEQWYKCVRGTATSTDVSMVCNALLGFRKQIETECSDVWMVAFGFIKSIEPDDGSFNDPLSFLWEMESSRWNELVAGENARAE